MLIWKSGDEIGGCCLAGKSTRTGGGPESGEMADLEIYSEQAEHNYNLHHEYRGKG